MYKLYVNLFSNHFKNRRFSAVTNELFLLKEVYLVRNN
jgi:hypothetical protein